MASKGWLPSMVRRHLWGCWAIEWWITKKKEVGIKKGRREKTNERCKRERINEAWMNKGEKGESSKGAREHRKEGSEGGGGGDRPYGVHHVWIKNQIKKNNKKLNWNTLISDNTSLAVKIIFHWNVARLQWHLRNNPNNPTAITCPK